MHFILMKFLKFSNILECPFHAMHSAMPTGEFKSKQDMSPHLKTTHHRVWGSDSTQITNHFNEK